MMVWKVLTVIALKLSKRNLEKFEPRKLVKVILRENGTWRAYARDSSTCIVGITSRCWAYIHKAPPTSLGTEPASTVIS